jgi:hypothetical protein
MHVELIGNFVLDLVDRVEQIRVNYRISREVLGRNVMDMSGMALGKMLRYPEPWETLSEEKRDRFRKLAAWCYSFDPNSDQNRALIHETLHHIQGGSYFGRRHACMPRLNVKLDTAKIVRELTRRLGEHDICIGYFADRKLSITKKYMHKLMTVERDMPWEIMPHHVRRLFGKMKFWCERSDAEFANLKRMQALSYTKIRNR